MASTLPKPAIVAAIAGRRATTAAYWAVTTIFCLQMSFTAYAQLFLPQVAEAPGGVGLGRGHRRTLDALVCFLAPPPGFSGESLNVSDSDEECVP